jgi:transposase
MQQHFFQQDNASCHVSRQSKSFFHEKEVKILDWPANSPDLNPIENMWGILKRAVELRSPKTLAELEAFAIDEWRKIPLQIIRNSIASMPRH